MAEPPTMSSDPDRLSNLPGGLREHILGFLPVQEAARTCVLARSWRDLWKFTRRLVITEGVPGSSMPKLNRMVNRLLLLRRMPLDACEIDLNDYDDMDVDRINRWITGFLNCQVLALRLYLYRRRDFGFLLESWFPISDRPFASPHLTRLELHGIELTGRFLDFSSCTALEDLTIDFCIIGGHVRRIVSPSLKRLTISYCESSAGQSPRFRLRVPRLVSLTLDNPFLGNTPLLESMPELVVADIEIGADVDACSCVDFLVCHHVTSSESEDAGKTTMILGGLSEATHLTLLTHYKTYIIRRDLTQCPTFWKLKTLFLNDHWCVPADCRTLISILEHAPVLEKLTILFSQFPPTCEVEMKGGFDPERKAAIPEHLERVELVCLEICDTVIKVSKVLAFHLGCSTGENYEVSTEGAYTIIVLRNGRLKDINASIKTTKDVTLP